MILFPAQDFTSILGILSDHWRNTAAVSNNNQSYCNNEEKILKCIKNVLEYSLQDDSLRSSYRTWLLLFAAVLDDEDILVECILKWSNSVSSAARKMNSDLQMFKNKSSSIIKSLHPIFNNSTSKSIMTLHVCGHECVGKSQTVQSLKRTFDCNYFTKPRNSERNADIDLGDKGRTIGMESHSTMNFNYHDQCYQIIINDYGGKEAFRVNHSKFLSIENSIYIIVLPLYDKRTNDKVDIDTIIKMFKYWIGLFLSLVKNPNVLIILNFVKLSEAKCKDYSNYAMLELRSIFSTYSDVVHFLSYAPIALDSIYPRKVCHEMWSVLKDSIHDLKVQSNTIIPLIEEFLKYKKNQKWPFIMEIVDFQNKILHFILQSSMKSHLGKITNPKIIKFACGMMINMLVSKRDVVKLRLSGKDVYVVDVTCFASEVLGAIFNPLTIKLGMDEILNPLTTKLGMDEILNPLTAKLEICDEVFNPLITKLGIDERLNPLTTKLRMDGNLLHNKRLTVDCCMTKDIIHNRIKNLSTINNDINIAALLCQMGLCIPVSIDYVSNRCISSVGSINESETSSMYCFPAFASKLMELNDGTPIKGTECHNF